MAVESQIVVRGARVHNLKNVSLSIPRNRLVVVTGLSGSGKSSLAFDTLYAEGQRRYVESLSAYARQFLGRIAKPEVDLIAGIPPAIAIEQRVNTHNPRSTVGTSTELYDYLKLLYARIGRTFSPISGREVKRHSVTDVVNRIASYPEGTRLMLLAPLGANGSASALEMLAQLSARGFTRIAVGGQILRIDQGEARELLALAQHPMRLVVDRFAASAEEDFLSRCADSVQTAYAEGNGSCILAVHEGDSPVEELFSCRFEADGMSFEPPTEHLFSFNTPLGACPRCEGYGRVIGIDEELVVPDQSLSIYQDAIACWRGESMGEYKREFMAQASRLGFPVHRPYHELSDEHRALLWSGGRGIAGLHDFFAELESKKYKIQYRVMLSRYMGKTRCPDCQGARLRREATYVRVCGKSLPELVELPVAQLHQFFHETLCLDPHDQEVARRIVVEVRSRLDYLLHVGLGYLTLNRLSSTLSGGESQRINLATSLGSSLVGSLYILDEPSIGLHPRDTHRLIGVLRRLRDLGNTVVVVEHDEEIIRAADHLIDIGPLAGRLGGEVVFAGGLEALRAAKGSLTAQYINGTAQIPVPPSRRRWNSYIEIKGAREHNLKGIDVRFPLNCMAVVTGVSGSGKSTLVRGILYPALQRKMIGTGERAGQHTALQGDVHRLKGVVMVDQHPIGRSSRSNPVTYVKAYDEIRKLLAEQPYAKRSGYTPSHFSFNIDGGRCEECQGEGVIRVAMQFMADVTLTCESCHGMRFKEDILEVRYRQLNVYDMLEMTISQAMEFFGADRSAASTRIVSRLQPLEDVGLGYIKLGQSSSTLSGGESQRVKLAFFLQRDQATQPHLFLFDEPTTGLHFHDIGKLLRAFDALIAKGHSLIVIEHNLEVIKCADWVIDLGPEGGGEGGHLVFAGTPEELAQHPEGVTAEYLRGKLAAG